MPFRVGEQYTPGPAWSENLLRQQGITHDTTLTVTAVQGDGSLAWFGEISGSWFDATGWFIPLEHYIAWDETGIYVLDDGRHKLTFQEAQQIITRDIGNSNTVHIPIYFGC